MSDSRILTLHDLPSKATKPQEAAQEAEQAEAASMHDLPPGVRKPATKEQETAEILTMHDLPRKERGKP